MIRTKRIFIATIVTTLISVTALAQSKLHMDLSYQYSLGLSENLQDTLMAEIRIKWEEIRYKLPHVTI